MARIATGCSPDPRLRSVRTDGVIMVTSPRPGWSGPGPVSSPAHARLRGLRTQRDDGLRRSPPGRRCGRHRASSPMPRAGLSQRRKKATAADYHGKFEPSVPFVPGRPVAPPLPPLVPLPAKPPVPGAVAAVTVAADAGVATVASTVPESAKPRPCAAKRSRAGASLPFLRVIRAVRTGSGLSVRVLGVDGKDIAVGTVAAG
jgi:hypothetical protein